MRAGSSLVVSAALIAVVASVALISARRSHADAAYRAGLGFTEFPAEDVPGRLEAYDEAHRRAPRTFVYLLRSGQIHLARAAARGERHGEHLDLAGERLREAARVHPLDARARISLARLLFLEGDRSGALSEGRAALLLGPRHPAVQVGAVRLGVEAWAQDGDAAALAFALDADTQRRSWSEIHGVDRQERVPRFVAAALSSRVDQVLGDLLEAGGADAERLRTAREWCAACRPDLVDVLDGRLRRLANRRSAE